jgi:hypothetical protein
MTQEFDRDASPELFVWIRYRNYLGTPTDPTGYAVTIAVVTDGTRPSSGDYQSAQWVPVAQLVSIRDRPGADWFLAYRQVSGLQPGTYRLYPKVVAPPETWVDPSPELIVVR